MCTGPDTEQPPPSSPLGELQEMFNTCRGPYSYSTPTNGLFANCAYTYKGLVLRHSHFHAFVLCICECMIYAGEAIGAVGVTQWCWVR